MSFSRTRHILLVAVTLLTGSATAHAKTLERAEDALKRLFPNAGVEQKNILLSEVERKTAGELLGKPVDQALVTLFRITTEQGQHMTAYLDAHHVRTLPETLMVSVDEKGTIHSVDVLAFREPTEYMPRRAWYDQFSGKGFTRHLQLNRGIQGVTGATLTGRATVKATRKLLCIHRVIQDRDTSQ